MPSFKDVFLCHASEDKELFVRPIAAELERRGISYWLDEAEVRWGDKITNKINDGLRASRYVIVFLSSNFLGKKWPESEMGAAISKENSDGQTFVLPLIIDDASRVRDQYPLLREKAYLKWASGIFNIADQLERVLSEGKPVHSCADAPPSNTEPTLEDISHGIWDSNLGSKLGRFLRENRELAHPDLPISKLMDRLPEELQGSVTHLVAEYGRRASDIRAAIRKEPPSDGSLEIVSVASTYEAEFDVKVRNLSSDTIYITRIVLRILSDRGCVLPSLEPSAKYEIPIGSLAVGETTSLEVSHTIEPHRADRFLIALQSTRVVYVRLTFEYNKKYSVSENAWLWRQMQETANDVLQREASRAAWERWSTATPPCLKSFETTMADAPSSGLLAALETAYPDRNTRIRTLLAWFGSGSGPWSGYPSYEVVAENLLMTFPLDDLLSALEFPELTDNHIEGAARLFGAWTFRTKRKQDITRLPEPLRKALLKHCMASPNSDKRSWAQAAFGPQ